MPARTRWWRPIASALGPMLAVGGAVGLLLALSGDATSVAAVARSITVSLVYATLVGVPAWLLIDRAAPGLRRRRPLVRLSALAGIVLALSVAACALAGLLFIAIGWSEPSSYWRSFAYSARITVVVGAVCTVGATLWEGLRQRLDASQLAVARASELAAEARLSALEARVHPHFLFNTLNSVMSLIPGDPVRAEELLEKLSGLLRFSLDAGRRGLIPLGDEIHIVRAYLVIEAARLGERLRADIQIDPGLDSWLVPPFAVQTLVENSVRHAIAPRRAGGGLEVAARRVDGTLVITVRDDGGGFSRAELRPGHGLENLEARLDALFGDRARLDLQRGADDDAWMTVTVVVPA